MAWHPFTVVAKDLAPSSSIKENWWHKNGFKISMNKTTGALFFQKK